MNNSTEPKTKRFLEIDKFKTFIGVEEYLTPDTQRDAVKLGTTIAEGHNHCKNTSCTMAWNFFGKKFGKEFPVLQTMSTMGEYTYNAILWGYFLPGEKIQSWRPHVAMFNDLFQDNNLPFVANFSKFRIEEANIRESIEIGFPVILGTLITKDGHIVLLYRIYRDGKSGVAYAIIDPYGEHPKYKNPIADYYTVTEKEFDKYVNETCNCIWFERLT